MMLQSPNDVHIELKTSSSFVVIVYNEMTKLTSSLSISFDWENKLNADITTRVNGLFFKTRKSK